MKLKRAGGSAGGSAGGIASCLSFLLVSASLWTEALARTGAWACPVPVPPCSCRRDSKDLFCQNRKLIHVPRLKKPGSVPGATAPTAPASPYSQQGGFPLAAAWSLNLAHNDLDSLAHAQFKHVPLRALNLNYNRFLRHVSPGAFEGQEASLVALHLAGTDLDTIPTEALVRLDHLEELDLSRTAISLVDDRLFPEKLQKSVHRLRFAHNGLKVFPEAFSQVQWLDLSGNELDDVPFQVLRTMAPKVTELRLANNRFKKIPEGMQLLTGLTVVDFSGNRLTGIPEWLVNELRGSLQSLRHFGLANNRLECRQEDCGMYRLWRWVKEDPAVFARDGDDEVDSQGEDVPGSVTCFSPTSVLGRRLASLPRHHWTCEDDDDKDVDKDVDSDDNDNDASGRRREAHSQARATHDAREAPLVDVSKGGVPGAAPRLLEATGVLVYLAIVMLLQLPS